MDLMAYGLSAALAQIMTNLDNLTVLLAMLGVVGRARAVSGFLLANVVVLVLSTGLAAGLSQALSGWTGYLGVVPLGMGLLGIWQNRHTQDAPPVRVARSVSVFGVTALFLSLSADSFVLLSSVLGDAVPPYRTVGALGALSASVILAATALSATRLVGQGGAALSRLERFAPYVMVAAGLFVLANTFSDAI